MRNLKLTDITTGVGMPIKSGALKHIQLAYKEVLDYLTRGIVGTYDNTKGYVLFGCENSGAGSSYNISAGAIFYNGEIYLVDATTFTTSGGNVPVCTITTTYYTGTDADGVVFTDSVTRNVHEIRKIVIASGASGSGTVNYADLIFFSWQRKDVTASFSQSFGTNTVTSIIWRYKRFGDMVHANVYIIGNVSAYGANRCGFTFDLPITANILDVDENVHVAAVANIGLSTSGNVNNGYFTILDGATSTMNFKMIGSTTGDFTVGCSITYRI